MEKTISYLNSKTWYRTLKVFYLLAFFITLYVLISEAGNTYTRYPEYFALSETIKDIIIALIVFELIRRAFFYITLGTIRPKK